MSARKSKVVKVNISAGTYKDEAEAVKEANAIKRWLIRYCDKNGYSIKGKVWISTNSAYAGTVIIKGRKKEYKPNGKPLPTVVEAHIHMVLFCNPASTIVDALKSYLNKKHMKAVVWDKHCNSRAEVENAVEYAMRQSRKVRTIDYDRKDILSVDEWGYYEAVEKAEAKIKDNMAFTKSESEQTPETPENKSVSSISDTPETLTYKSIKYNYLYYYIVPTSYNHSIIKALLQNIIYYSRDSSRSSCSKIIFKKVLLKVPCLLKNVKLCVIIIVYDEFSIGDIDMAKNASLRKADKVENDEFYTQYDYIQKEINAYLEYNPDVFKGKTILLPCDDPEWSNFTKFFAQNFENFGLKKLISTSFAYESKNFKGSYQLSFFETESPEYDEDKTKTHGKIFTLTRDSNKSGVIDIDDLEWHYLEGDGDFRSDEVKALRDEADIIITNPPFSLFREFVAWIFEADKKAIIIGSQNAITYKEIFPLIKENRLWLGATCNSEDMVFGVPEGAEVAPKDREKAAKLGYVGNYTRLGNSCWFSNIDHGRRHQILQLMTEEDNLKFSRHKEVRNCGYQRFDNYDAINIPFTDAIPSDYEKEMGVPISFLYKYNPTQFEIIDGIGRYSILDNENTKKAGKYLSMINGEAKFFRIIIRKR